MDILKPSVDPFSVAPADVLATVFRTDPGDPLTLAPTRMRFNPSPYAGQTVRLRFAQVDNRPCLVASVDDIDVQTRLPTPPGPPPCTITRGSGNDVIRGTRGDDVICAGGGNEVVNGGSGNDRILGQDGNDVLRGGSGNDTILGNGGNDVVNGGSGNDRILGQDGNDVLRGGS